MAELNKTIGVHAITVSETPICPLSIDSVSSNRNLPEQWVCVLGRFHSSTTTTTTTETRLALRRHFSLVVQVQHSEQLGRLSLSASLGIKPASEETNKKQDWAHYYRLKYM